MAKPILLCDTKGMSRERWLECREHGPDGDIEYTVGGSDVAAIFGLSPWVTPLELWRQKKGLMKPSFNNEAQKEMGHMLEPIIAHWYGQKTGNTVTDDTGLYQHADYPYALANLDRRFTEPSGKSGILECKSTTYHKSSDWYGGAQHPQSVCGNPAIYRQYINNNLLHYTICREILFSYERDIKKLQKLLPHLDIDSLVGRKRNKK